jgi:integrase
LIVTVGYQIYLQLYLHLITNYVVLSTKGHGCPKMSIEPPSLTAPTTLDAVINAVLARTDIGIRRRQEMASAVRVTSRLLGQPATAIPADPKLLRGRIAEITAAGAGLSPARWRNAKSLVSAALTITGASTMGRRSTATLRPEWHELLARVSDRYDRAKLSKLARYCSHRALPPEEVNDEVLSSFCEMLVRSTIERPKQVHRDACLTWNMLIDRINGWPPVRLTVPNNARTYSIALEDLPLSFQTDLQAYLVHLAGQDLFGDVPTPASDVTLRCQRIRLLELASALVLSGRDVLSITTLADLVAVDAAKLALNFFWRRNGQRKTGQLHNFARLIVNIAKHWAKVPTGQLDELRALSRKINPGKGDMTERNRARLRAFDDPANVERLVNLPESMMRPLTRLRNPGYNDAVRAQTALAIAIELVAPMRAKNLAGLRLDRHLIRSRPEPGAVMHLVIPSGEVKNKNPLEFELPRDVVRLLELYLKKFRPLLVTDGSRYVFPARKGGAKTPAQMAEQIKRTIKIDAGLTMNLHLFRHLCAYLYLKAHPGEYETVRLLLGHSSLAVTVRAYCGLERSDAVRRYDSLIDTYRGPPRDEPHDR